jgi:hypothetical protein
MPVLSIMTGRADSGHPRGSRGWDISMTTRSLQGRAPAEPGNHRCKPPGAGMDREPPGPRNSRGFFLLQSVSPRLTGDAL